MEEDAHKPRPNEGDGVNSVSFHGDQKPKRLGGTKLAPCTALLKGGSPFNFFMDPYCCRVKACLSVWDSLSQDAAWPGDGLAQVLSTLIFNPIG